MRDEHERKVIGIIITGVASVVIITLANLSPPSIFVKLYIAVTVMLLGIF
ncbi:MAG: hypothetical protein ACFFER_17830 [Candidatus Thorarchaeota archaeon]